MPGQKTEIKEGNTVQGKGKHGKELEGTVISVTGRYCKVELVDGTTETILKKDVKNVFETSTRRRTVRSHTRKETQKSQSRSKSRSRSRSRNRNVVPVRKSRKSTGNAVTSKENTYSLSSPAHEDFILTRTSLRTSSKVKSIDIVHQPDSVPSASASEIKQLIVSSDSEPESAIEREDETKIQPKKQVEANKETKFKFYQTVFWILQFFLLPAIAILVRLTCVKNRCTIMEVPSFPKQLYTYFDLKVSIIYVGWIVLQAALMFVPYGNLVKSFSSSDKSAETILKYRLNGFVALVVNSMILGILAYLQQPLDVVYYKYLQLMIVSIIFSMLFAFFLYARTFLKRKDVEVMNQQEEFSLFGKMFNFKVYCYRVGMLAWMSVNICLLYKSYFKDNTVDFSLLISAICQLFYVVDTYWREETLLTTASFQQDKLNFFTIIRLCTFVPFISAFPLMYIITHNPKNSQNWWLLGSSGFLFACGYWIYLKSSRGKHIYLKNPHDPSIAYVKRILPSLRQKQQGWLNHIRHPNYLGEFLMHLAWTLPCGFHHAPPYIPIFLTLIYLAKRFMQIEKDQAKDYVPSNKHHKEIH